MVSLPILQTWLSGLEVVEPVNVEGLQIFGLRRQPAARLSYLTLDEALGSDVVDITEVDEGGQVPTLKVKNKSDSMVFLMAGEELIGAKQNRVLNVSLMVGAREEMPVPVSCVEAGRWRYHSRKFSSRGTSSHSRLRAQMASQATEGYRSGGRPSSRQGEVWQEVNDKLRRMKSVSGSAALHKIYEDYDERLRDITEKTSAPEDCCGVAFALGGRLAGVDVFDQPQTLSKLWPKLVRSFAVDALEISQDQGSVSQEDVARWLEAAASSEVESYKSPGKGEDLRLKSKALHGGSLLVDDQPVHTEIFATVQ